ncbi:MAG: recombination regulator RecX [Cellvibrionaceae bacterium]|nr:recombination regulator RecX [Cellvibrionaceae bacterium]
MADSQTLHADITQAKDGDKAIENSALQYLGRREHSRYELQQKLLKKAYLLKDIDRVLDKLSLQDYQSDERFTEMYVRSRINAGDGPFKIKIALRQKGICDSLSLAIFDRLAVDWMEKAQRLKQRKFGDAYIQDGYTLAKQMRYLKNKGFCQEHIARIFAQTGC